MRKLISNRDLKEIAQSSNKVTNSLGRTHTFYVINETVESVGSNPIDPIFGDPINPFDYSSVTVHSQLTAFKATVTSDKPNTVYGPAGIFSGRFIDFEVSIDTVKRQNINWKSGMLIMANGEKYRVTDIIYRGFLRHTRIFMSAEKVT